MRNFKSVLILAAPFDEGGTPAVVKILAICFGVTERPLDVHDEVHKRFIILILYVIYVIRCERRH